MVRSRTIRRIQAGITLVEALAIVVILLVLIAVLFPVFSRPREHNLRLHSCLSNEKQIGLAIIMYTQDYNEVMPPARKFGMAETTDAFPEASWENIVYPYVKQARTFHCPSVPSGNDSAPRPTYRYSDLVADANTKEIPAPARTISLMDGDVAANDVGHAWTPDAAPLPTRFNPDGTCVSGQSGTVQKAAVRHHGGAVYAFADGHVKYLQPTQVFFPPRSRSDGSHKNPNGFAVGPDPTGDMTFAGTTYAATFLR